MEFNDSSGAGNSVTLSVGARVGLSAVNAALCLVYLWVILSVAVCRQLRNHSNYFLVSLYVNECLICLLAAVTINTTNSTIPTNEIILFLPFVSFMACCACYFFNSTMIAADRYFKIANPMKYVRFMSDKLCVCVILVVWGVSLIFGIGLYFGILGTAKQDLISIIDVFNNRHLLTLSAILMDSVVIPCMVLITVSFIGLLIIARNQQRKIKAERINLGNIAADNHDHINNQQRPQNVRTSKLTWYSCAYCATIIMGWVPSVIVLNLIALGTTTVQEAWVPVLILGSASMLQMVSGALFLTYTQKDHRLVLRNAYKSIVNLLTRQ